MMLEKLIWISSFMLAGVKNGGVDALDPPFSGALLGVPCTSSVSFHCMWLPWMAVALSVHGLECKVLENAFPVAPAARSLGNLHDCGTFTGGSPAPDPLRRPPPPPPPPHSLEIGPKVPDHGRRRRLKQTLLEPVEGEKMGYHPMCLYSKYSVF